MDALQTNDIMYEWMSFLSQQIMKYENMNDTKVDDAIIIDIKKAFKRSLTYVTDVVTLNGKTQYPFKFLSNDWCSFIIKYGLKSNADDILQYLDFALHREFCVEQMFDIIHWLESIIDGEENNDDIQKTQARNIRKYIYQKFGKQFNLKQDL